MAAKIRQQRRRRIRARTPKPAPGGRSPQLTFLDDERAILDHVPRRREHPRRCRRPGRRPSRRHPRRRRDDPCARGPSRRAGPARVMIAISLRVYSRESPSASALPASSFGFTCLSRSSRTRRSIRSWISAGYERKEPPFGMIGGEHHPPWIRAQQKQLEADRPLQRRYRRLVLEGERHDAAAGLQLDVDVGPPPSAALVQQILDRARRR